MWWWRKGVLFSHRQQHRPVPVEQPTVVELVPLLLRRQAARPAGEGGDVAAIGVARDRRLGRASIGSVHRVTDLRVDYGGGEGLRGGRRGTTGGKGWDEHGGRVVPVQMGVTVKGMGVV